MFYEHIKRCSLGYRCRYCLGVLPYIIGVVDRMWSSIVSSYLIRLIIPPQTMFVCVCGWMAGGGGEGYTVSTLSVRPPATFWFFNVFKRQ